MSQAVPSSEAPSQHTQGFRCSVCGQDFLSLDELHTHHIMYHYFSPALAPSQHSLSQVPDIFSCTMCGEIFHDVKLRLQHMNTAHGVSIYPCTLCEEIFGSSRLLCQHRKTKHGDDVTQLACPLCGKTFTTALNLKGHMNMHQGLKPYKCLKCGEAFAYSQSKHRHQKLCNRLSFSSNWSF